MIHVTILGILSKREKKTTKKKTKNYVAQKNYCTAYTLWGSLRCKPCACSPATPAGRPLRHARPAKPAYEGGASHAHVTRDGAAHPGHPNTGHMLLPPQVRPLLHTPPSVIFYLNKMCKRCFCVARARTQDFYICHPRTKGRPRYTRGDR